MYDLSVTLTSASSPSEESYKMPPIERGGVYGGDGEVIRREL